MYKLMTPGPTQVRENVRMARSLKTTNPDLDPAFYEYYKDTCQILSDLLNTKNPAFVLSGEGILGLEAACASLTEHGDRVLVIDNGVFGKGFADFVKIYGGTPVSFVSDYHRSINVDELRDFLKKDSNFKYATVVHCDTPSGVLNDIDKICKLLSEYNIISVVDSVAGMFGEYINIDESKIDILCGGSQKVLSAAVGLTMVFVSEKAFAAMENRKTPIASFYCNLLNFKNYYVDKWFPYTMPISDIYGLRAALENVRDDKDILERHRFLAAASRDTIVKAGLELYLEDGYADTVTVVKIPKGLTDKQILDTMKNKYNIMLAGSFDVLAGKVFRIGHMGENARAYSLIETFLALDNTFHDLKYPLNASLADNFKLHPSIND